MRLEENSAEGRLVDRWTEWSEPNGAVQKEKVNKRLDTSNDGGSKEGRKKDVFSGRHFAGVSASAEWGLTVSVMKGALSVKPITCDWCSWVADW